MKKWCNDFGMLMLGNATAYTIVGQGHYGSAIACGIIGMVFWVASVLMA